MTEVYQKANIKNQKYKEKSKNVQICNEKVKNSTVSRGASGHGLFYICREYSTNRPFFAKRSQIQRQNTEFRIQKTGEEGKTKPNEPNSKPIPSTLLTSASSAQTGQDKIHFKGRIYSAFVGLAGLLVSQSIRPISYGLTKSGCLGKILTETPCWPVVVHSIEPTNQCSPCCCDALS
jgi:hypothetical protein